MTEHCSVRRGVAVDLGLDDVVTERVVAEATTFRFDSFRANWACDETLAVDWCDREIGGHDFVPSWSCPARSTFGLDVEFSGNRTCTVPFRSTATILSSSATFTYPFSSIFSLFGCRPAVVYYLLADCRLLNKSRPRRIHERNVESHLLMGARRLNRAFPRSIMISCLFERASQNDTSHRLIRV